MISLIFILLSGLFDSIKDHCNHHWKWYEDSKLPIIQVEVSSRLRKWISKFTNDPDYWWYQPISWKNKYEGTWLEKLIVQVSDADHFFKTLRIICWLLAIVFYIPIIEIWVIPVIITDFLILGVARNIIFNVFYKLWR